MLPSLWWCRVQCVDDVGQDSNNNSLTWRPPPLHPHTSIIFRISRCLQGTGWSYSSVVNTVRMTTDPLKKQEEQVRKYIF